MKRSLLVLGVLILLAAVAIAGFMWLDRRRATYYTDAQTIRQPAAEASLRQTLWRPPVSLPHAINTLDHEYEARLSADGMTLFFVRGQPDSDADLFVSHRLSGNGSSQEWSSPRPFHEVNSDVDDLGPEPSADGNSLYFYSNRPGGAGGFDLWVSHRTDAGWQAPINLGPVVNSQNNEHSPALSPDGSQLYFASDRSRVSSPDQTDPLWSATLRENLPSQDYDLYSLRIDQEPWPAPQPVTALNSPCNDGAPCFSAAGDFLYFSSDRPGGRGGFDLYRARLVRGEYQPPNNLGPEINSRANELDPSLSFDGFALHFSSDRELSSSTETTELNYDIFFAVSREVFAERSDAPGIDWASLWAMISPGFRWSLLGLLSLLLFLLLLKPVHSRRLTLLARCALISLMAHLVLMIVLSFWQVTTELSDIILDQGKGSKVALSSYGAGDALTSQVRGGLNELVSFSSQPLSARAASSLEIDLQPATVQLSTEPTPSHFNDAPLVLAHQSDQQPPAMQPPPLDSAAPQMDATPLVAMQAPSQAQPIRSTESAPNIAASGAAAIRNDLDVPQAESSELVTLTPSIVSLDSLQASLPAAQLDAQTAIEPPSSLLPSPDAAAAAVSAPTSLASIAAPSESAPDSVGTEAQMSPSAAHTTARRAAQDRVDGALSLRPRAVRVEPEVQEFKGDIQVFASSMIAAAPAASAAITPIDVSAVTPPQAHVPATALPTSDGLGARSNLSQEPTATLAVASPAAQRAGGAIPSIGEITVHASVQIQPQAPRFSADGESLASSIAAPNESRPPVSSDQSPVVTRLDPGEPSANGLSLPLVAAGEPGQVTSRRTEGEAHAIPATMPMTARRAGNRLPTAASASAFSSGVNLEPQVQHLGGAAQSFASPTTVRDEAMPQGDAGPATLSIMLAGDSNLASDNLRTPWGEAGPNPPAKGRGLRTEASPSPPASALAVQRSQQRIPVSEIQPSSSNVQIQPPQLAHSGQLASLAAQDPESTESRPPEFANLAAFPSIAEAPELLPDNLVPPALSAAQSLGQEPGQAANAPPTSSKPAARRVAVAFSGGMLPDDQATVRLSPVPADVRALRPDSRATPPGFSDSAPVQIQPDQSGIGRATPELTNLSPLAGVSDFKLPTDLAPPADPYVQRTHEKRKELVERMGGSEATEQAVELALQWFAAHQADDGHWGARSFDHGCGECDGPAKFDTDIAVTGLALLCFLAADHTHLKDGPYRDNVRKGIDWICAQQQRNGDWRGGESMYSHGIASIAIAETLGMTADPKLRQPVIDAVDFICRARNTEIGGWRYEPGQMGDTSVLGWIVMALVSAKSAGITVPDEVFPAASRWLALVSAETRPGRYSYQPGQRFSPSMSAEGMYVQHLLGLNRNDPRMLGSAEYLHEHPPRWRDAPSTYYWYYATLALYQHQGALWTRWNEMLTEQLLENQNKTGPAAGSWDPVDSWSRIGGRVYQTALCTLSLEVYYRYLPMYHLTDRGNSPSTPSPDQPR